MSAEGESHADGRLRLDFPAEHVGRLTLDDAAKRNALDHPTLDAIAALVPTLARRGVRCLVVGATGPVFSAGYDIGGLALAGDDRSAVAGETRGPASEDFAERAERLVAHPFIAALEALEAFPYPAIAALQGHAIGGGLELALACDLRVASPGAQLGMPPAKLGLVYSHTGLRKFVDAIGAPRTRELFLVGRRIDAPTALSWGLVNEIADDADARALELATEVAGNAPLSLEGNKRIIRELLAAQGEIDAVLEQELVALRESCFTSEDFLEGVRAFEDKRPARWSGR